MPENLHRAIALPVCDGFLLLNLVYILKFDECFMLLPLLRFKFASIRWRIATTCSLQSLLEFSLVLSKGCFTCKTVQILLRCICKVLVDVVYLVVQCRIVHMNS